MKTIVILIVVGSSLFCNSLYAQQGISPDEAKSHIGEIKYVEGYAVKEEYRKVNRHKGLLLTYWANKGSTEPVFINMVILNLKNGIIKSSKGYKDRNLKNILAHINEQKEVPGQFPQAAEGKIILFEGLPCIQTNFDDVIILEPVG